MTSKERVRIALEGGKPDKVPVFPIYDCGYILRATGRDLRDWVARGSRERVRIVEDGLLLHDVDGMFVHAGCDDSWRRRHRVTPGDAYWTVTERKTGRRFRLLADGSQATTDGVVIPGDDSAGGISRIQSESDILEVAPATPSRREMIRSGRFKPLNRLVRAYPDHHFSFQVTTPMVAALRACGGFVEGLTMLAADRRLFSKLLRHFIDESIVRLDLGRSIGGHSIFFTSYYTGADTISPLDYKDIIFPVEAEICEAAKARGLNVLDWFLGDLYPILDDVAALPIDAFVLEQGRKGYDIDPVEIRKRIGPDRCIFGFGYEIDYIQDNRTALSTELERQFAGAGADGAFVAGTPIMPPDADPGAVEFYFSEARRIGTT